MNHEPIPRREVLHNDGLISSVWHQFLYKIFGNIYSELSALKKRVDDLENP
jgi:hypothetical protein